MKITDLIFGRLKTENYRVLDNKEAESIRSTGFYRFFIGETVFKMPLSFFLVVVLSAGSILGGIFISPLFLPISLSCFMVLWIEAKLSALEPLDKPYQIESLHEIARENPEVAHWLIESSSRECTLRNRDLWAANLMHQVMAPRIAIERNKQEFQVKRVMMMNDLRKMQQKA